MADRIEALAQFLHDEGGFGDAWPDRSWPEHPDDTGQRDGGWLKIVPSDVQAKFRDVARRWFASSPTAAACPFMLSNCNLTEADLCPTCGMDADRKGGPCVADRTAADLDKDAEIARLREALARTQWMLESIVRHQATNFAEVHERIIANRAALTQGKD